MSQLVYLHTLNPFALRFSENFGVRWYGLAYLAGFFLGHLLIVYLAKRRLSPVPVPLAGDFVFTVALGTIIGGRLGYCLFYSPDLLVRFTWHPPFWGALAINEGGMASHGGILGIIAACLYFARKHNLPALHLFDLTTLGGTLGIFFGRLANFVNGELVGRPAPPSAPFVVKFPQDILLWPSYEIDRLPALRPAAELVGINGESWIEWTKQLPFHSQAYSQVSRVLGEIVSGIQHSDAALAAALAPVLTPRYPSQLIEALLEGAFLFLCMIFIWRRPRKQGVIAGWFFILYAAVRIYGEQFRMPDIQIGFQLLGLTRGQWLSVVMFVFGLGFLARAARRPDQPIGGWASKKAGL